MADFKIGDLVFAKMRGFPHWPAQIAKVPSVEDPKYSVYFFGTHETAFVRSVDVLDYQSNLEAHGQTCKRGGFQKALDEIQEVASRKTSEVSPKKDSNQLSASNASIDSNFSPPSNKRLRIPNRFYNDDDFVVPQAKRRHANSEHNQKPEQSSPEEVKQHLNVPNASGTLRRRTDSTSSNERSRKRLFSERSGVDLSDIEPTLNNQKLLSNGWLSLFEGIESEHSEDDALKMFGATRSRRRTRSSRLLDEHLFGSNFLKSPRDRSGSLSSTNGRTRLISNISISDNFDDLAKIFNPNELLQAIDDYSSEESDRPMAPDESNQAGLAEKRCYHCQASCEVWKRKWRCTNKECNRWNGSLETSTSKKPHPLSYSTWDRSFLSDLPVSDSSINNDPITCLPTEQLATFSSEQPQFSTTTNPATNTSGDESMLDQIKEYLLDAGQQQKKTEDPNQSSQQAQNQQINDQTPQYGFITQSYVDKQDNQKQEDTFAMKQPVYEDLASPPTVRFEQYTPINKRIIKTSTRAKSKVENTPPADVNGIRQCMQCPGHVRPQMCGGNKHRWRCVDKRCRKWYGWVKSDDIIPPDLGKKGRWKDLVIRVQSSANEFEDRRACDMIHTLNPDSISLHDESEFSRNRRKYKRRSASSRNVSPLSVREKHFGPSQLESKPRWWLNSDRRRVDTSPERNIGSELLDAAASFRLMGNSMLTAATTKADEYGSLNGAIDLMLDSLLSSMAPLLTMTKFVPGLELPEGIIQRVWDTTTLHTPML